LLSILIPYRDRKTTHVKNSLESLSRQRNKSFEVFFIDYGSSGSYASAAKDLCKQYSFVTYVYYPVVHQPWNKSRALNSCIRNLKTEYCFVSDIDMIFHQDFVATAQELQKIDKCVYFQVGFLNRNEDVDNKIFEDFTRYRKSTFEATGLSMFPVKALRELNGFDEFYHFWGAEDTDIHIRFKNVGYKVEFYKERILMLHQWHPTYRLKETSKLTADLQLSGIVALNHHHLKDAAVKKKIQVNYKQWGEIPSAQLITELEQAEVLEEIENKKQVIQQFIYGRLPQVTAGIVKVRILDSGPPVNIKFHAKKIFNKNRFSYYSLKEVNDLILLHLISFYRDRPYYYRVDESLKFIELAIKF
jgi:glycosyltransferase involved in cell wall biosynthesis